MEYVRAEIHRKRLEKKLLLQPLLILTQILMFLINVHVLKGVFEFKQPKWCFAVFNMFSYMSLQLRQLIVMVMSIPRAAFAKLKSSVIIFHFLHVRRTFLMLLYPSFLRMRTKISHGKTSWIEANFNLFTSDILISLLSSQIDIFEVCYHSDNSKSTNIEFNNEL